MALGARSGHNLRQPLRTYREGPKEDSWRRTAKTRSLEVLKRLARALGVPVTELLE
jgi:hypothetical protein